VTSASLGQRLLERLRILQDPESGDRLVDRLDFAPRAEALATVLASDCPPHVVGVIGGFGTGKTTLMKIAEEKLRAKLAFESLWFDAWGFLGRVDLWLALAHKVVEYLRRSGQGLKKLRPPLWRRVVGKAYLRLERREGIVTLWQRLIPGPWRSYPPLVEWRKSIMDSQGLILAWPSAKGKLKKFLKQLDTFDEALSYVSISEPVKPWRSIGPVLRASGAGLRGLGKLRGLAGVFLSAAGAMVAALVPATSRTFVRERAKRIDEIGDSFSAVVNEYFKCKASLKVPKQAPCTRLIIWCDDIDRVWSPEEAIECLEGLRTLACRVARGPCTFVVSIDPRILEMGVRLAYRTYRDSTQGVSARPSRDYALRFFDFYVFVPEMKPEKLVAAGESQIESFIRFLLGDAAATDPLVSEVVETFRELSKDLPSSPRIWKMILRDFAVRSLESVDMAIDAIEGDLLESCIAVCWPETFALKRTNASVWFAALRAARDGTSDAALDELQANLRVFSSDPTFLSFVSRYLTRFRIGDG